jgi:hypothetical protein
VLTIESDFFIGYLLWQICLPAASVADRIFVAILSAAPVDS